MASLDDDTRSFDDQYSVRTFSPVVAGDGPESQPDDATRDWIAATRIAFHQSGGNDPLPSAAVSFVDDGRVFTGVYANEPSPGSLPATWPVATYAGYTKTINVGGGSLVDSYLISDVTVRPTHKRQGILRRMMTERLADAASRGLVLAALTASEATIYRRFGFGPAVRNRSIVITPRKGFNVFASATGRSELAEAATLGDIARDVFARHHARTPGSVDRHRQLWDRVLGLHTDSGKPDAALRAAVHYPTGGGPVDAFVTYRIIDDEGPTTLEIVDLVAADANAYLGIWQFVGSVDLVDRITFKLAAPTDGLDFALVDGRAVATSSERDHVWLRILDVEAALAARPYAVQGTIVLRVHDDLGFAEGTFTLTASMGSAGGGPARVGSAGGGWSALGSTLVTSVPSSDGPADLELDAATLATLYLGDVSATVLVEAGLVTELTPGAAVLASAMFAADRPVSSITDF